MDDSADFEILWRQASELERQGEVEKAREMYLRCLELGPENARLWLQYAIFLQDQKQWHEAITAAEHAAKAKNIGDRALALCHIGRCYRELNQYRDAENAYRQSIEIEPHDYIWVLLFSVLSAQDREEEAIECLYQALQLNPDYEEAHYNLGCHYRKQKEYDLAEQYLRRAVEIDPQYALAYAELGWVIYARALELQQQIEREGGDLKEVKRLFQEARRLLEKAVELQPSHVWGHTYLGSLLDHTNHEKEAEQHYQEALRLLPDHSMTLWLYGDFLSRCGNHAQAGQLLNRAVEIAISEDDDAGGHSHFFMGKHYQRLKRTHKAKEAFHEAARRGHAKAQKILDTI